MPNKVSCLGPSQGIFPTPTIRLLRTISALVSFFSSPEPSPFLSSSRSRLSLILGVEKGVLAEKRGRTVNLQAFMAALEQDGDGSQRRRRQRRQKACCACVLAGHLLFVHSLKGRSHRRNIYPYLKALYNVY